MTISRIAAKAFAASLRMYPPRFRSAFGPEIAEVFVQSLQEAERRGILQALAVVFRELVDFPVNLIAEYWEETHMQNIQLSQPEHRAVWWGAVGFGSAAALANLFHWAVYIPSSGTLADFAEHFRFWGEFLGYAILGGLGGFSFALVSRQPAKARLYFIAGSFGFLIGHLLWYAIMVGSGVFLFYADAGDVVFLIGNIVVGWVDIALMMSLSGLFIGWMEKSRSLAGRLFGTGALGAGIGGLLGFGLGGLVMLFDSSAFGSSVVARLIIINGTVFAVNGLAGFFGGALLGKAIDRENPARNAPLVT
jgi:hypothetical protein